MISKNVKSFCENPPDLIKNYDKAISSDEMWDCHHRLETHTSDGERRLVQLTKDELIALDMYYQRPANELIFLSRSEHRCLHNLGNSWSKGKHLSEEAKRKLSLARKGNSNRPKRIIVCLETQEEHPVTEWSRLGYDGARKVANGLLNSSKGLHFKYKETA